MVVVLKRDANQKSIDNLIAWLENQGLRVNINKGELFSEKNIRVIRPGYGAKPKHFVTLLDMRSDRDYLEGEPIMYTQDSESGF